MQPFKKHEKEKMLTSEEHYKKERIIDFFLNHYGYWTDYHVTLDAAHIERTFNCIVNAEETGLDILTTIVQDDGITSIVLTSAYTIAVDKNNRVISFVMPTLTQMRKIIGNYILPETIFKIIIANSSNKGINYTKDTAYSF